MIGTGAGHDAGILAEAGIPAAMIFVRNPTGVSHSPAEFAERDDCLAGVEALTDGAARSGWCRHDHATGPSTPGSPRAASPGSGSRSSVIASAS